MPVLENIKVERFANNIAEGMTSEQAHKSAGFRGINHKLLGEQLRCKVEVKARIKELTGRISKQATNRAASKLALDKEMVLRKLVENAARAEQVKGGSSVVTRCWELIGKHLGMWQDGEQKPMTAEDLTIEQLEEILKGAPKPQVQ